jgi:regulator of protease activity HflC (stomatin/prohibitin superfamily)
MPHLRLLTTLVWVFGAIGILLVVLAVLSQWTEDVIGSLALACVGSSLLVATAGLASSRLVAWVRQHVQPFDLVWIATWPQILVAIGLCLVAVAGVISGWRLPDAVTPSPSGQVVFGIALVLGAFPVLVLERVLDSITTEELPDARRLQTLLRLPLITLLVTGIATALQGTGFTWPIWLEKANGALVVLVATEVILRAGVRLFLPHPPIEHAQSVVDSSIARAIRLTSVTLTSVTGAVQKEFGIDLSRSWALAFVRRAMLPVAACLAVLAWVCTGITALPLDSRAIYERLGTPVSVFGPGIHLGMPWPLGIVRRVELGVIHDIPIVFSASTKVTSGTDQGLLQSSLPGRGSAEGPPPPRVDRLWDQPHASEATYLVASESRGQQSFQVVDIDLRLVYRVGLSDQAAMAAAYSLTDPERLVQAAAGRRLARYFASHTLPAVLGENRETFTAEFRVALQADLDRLGTGLEAIAVVVEAIHPPQGAASAYHSVQAAEIEAQIAIATERGAAAQTASVAAQDAVHSRDQGLSQAGVTLAQAEADRALFDGDRAAYSQGHSVFVLERWFARLMAGLSRLPLVIVDHRISGTELPSLDLRGSPAPGLPPR